MIMGALEIYHLSKRDLENHTDYSFKWDKDEKVGIEEDEKGTLKKDYGYEVMGFVNNYCDSRVILRKEARLSAIRKVMNAKGSGLQTYDDYAEWLDDFDFIK